MTKTVIITDRMQRGYLNGDETGRPKRSYKIGTTIMLSAVELNKPNMITIAIGA